MTTYRFCPLCAAPLEPLAGGEEAGRPACPSGHFVHYDNPAVTTMALLRDEQGRVLMLQRAREPFRGRWDFPGGFVNAGETPQAAIEREVAEEIGLTVELGEIVGTYASRYGDGDDARHTVDVAFTARVTGGELRLSDEHLDGRWFALDEAPEPAFAGERAALERLRRK
ncbi:MAG TPA: NUDIX hydrolase [Capillimicrobium sp.]|nr:NUDIX hydrolase [Capillimicrobium sp.]